MLAHIPTWLRRYWWTGPVGVLAVGAIWAILWPLTDVLATHDVSGYAAALRAAHLQSARQAARTQLLTLGAGLFAAGALFYTARNFTLSRQQFQQSGQQFTEQLELSRKAAQDSAEAERRTLELTEQGQVTDRYTKAIEQLGSDKLDVRIGGIYALERIARDSERDHPTVMEVLSAFIREHSVEQRPLPAADKDASRPWTRPDVQAAITVIGRRNPEHDVSPCDLRDSVLIDAVFIRANLIGANFSSAKLTGANFSSAKLTGAFMALADLTGASFSNTLLANANLMGATLSGAYLSDADLRGADLRHADLTKVNLKGADLTGAVWPESYTAPDGWARDPDIGLLRRSGQDEPTGEALPSV